MKFRTTLRAGQSLRLNRFRAVVRCALPSRLRSRVYRILSGVAAACTLSLLLGCYNFNPYLGASPTVTSTITSISPSGAPAGHPDILLTVTGAGFVAGSNVTWNSSSGSGSSSTNLLNPNVVSATEIQATIPAALLANPGKFFVGVIAPGPTSGNNAGNNISNFVPFIICPQPPGSCSSLMPSAEPRSALPSPEPSASRLSALTQNGSRYQAIVADSADAAVDTGTGIAKIFLRDTCLGAAAACAPQIIPISVGWNGTDPNGPSSSPSVTADGRFAVFASEANNLVKGDGNGWMDIFLRDTCIGAASTCAPATIRLSVGPDGAEANGPSFSPAISPDGRFVAFNSWATNLVQPQVGVALPTTTPSLFLRDTCFGAAPGCAPTTSRVIPASASPH